MNTFLEAALSYRGRGWSPLPLEVQGKAPLVPWKVYQGRLASEQELKLFWNRWPEPNVGIVMGHISGLIGVDVDGPAGEALIAALP